MNRGTVYALACVAVMAAIIMVASVTLPHYEPNQGSVTKYAVTNNGQTCSGDYQENLANGLVFVNSDYDNPYPLSGEKKLPTFNVSSFVTFSIGSSTDITGVYLDKSTNSSTGAVTVVAVLIYSDSATVSTWVFNGASSVSCSQGAKGVFMEVNLTTSCTYSVSSDSSHGYFVITHSNTKDYGGSDTTSFGVFSQVPSGKGIQKPTDMEFLVWMDGSSVATATSYYAPGSALTKSLELYALWGMEMECTKRGFYGDDQQQLSDATVRLWNGDEKSITDLNSFAAPTDFKLTVSGGSGCTDMEYGVYEAMSEGKLVYNVFIDFTYSDHEIHVQLVFNNMVALSKTPGTNYLEMEIVQKQGSSFSMEAYCNKSAS